MQKIITFLFLILMLIISGCNLPIPNNPNFDDSVATNVSIAKTATIIQKYILDATNAANPTQNTPTNTPTPQPTQITPTSTQDNFIKSLGIPSWKDELNNGGNWNLIKPNTDTPNVTTKVENGALVMARTVPYGGKNWWLNYQKIQDFYLEGVFTTEDCRSDDQYGLIFRALNYFDGFGFYFTVTCDGNFNLMRWNPNGAINLFNWEKSNNIQAGPNQTNHLGIWAKGDLIRLYTNEIMIKEISDSTLSNQGHFGLFIDSRQTPGFTIKLDEIAYWNLQ
jgi:hypothetical protein